MVRFFPAPATGNPVSPRNRVSGASAAVALLLCVSGCGLKEYENKLEAEQERMKKFDEAEQLLGNPVEYPARASTGPVVPKNENILFRAPVVIAVQPDGPAVDGFFFRFPRSGATSPSLTAPTGRGGPAGKPPVRPPPGHGIQGPLDPALEKEGGFREMYLALASTGKMVDFRKNILSAFPGAKAESKRPEERFAHDPITYEVWSWVDPAKPTSVYHIYAHQHERYMVAIVYHLGREKEKSAAVRSAEKYSLQSLFLGSEANLLNQNFKTRPAPQKAPAL